MTKIYTLTLAPSLDSATQTPQIYPEGKLRCSAPYLNPEAAVLTWREPSLSWRQRHGYLSVGGATGEHLTALLTDEHVPVDTVETHDWTRQNLHVHVNASGEQYRFVMHGAALTADGSASLRKKFSLSPPARCW